MLAVERTTSVMADGKVSELPSVSQGEDLNLITPLSSMNVTPNEQDVIYKFCIYFVYTHTLTLTLTSAMLWQTL